MAWLRQACRDDRALVAASTAVFAAGVVLALTGVTHPDTGSVITGLFAWWLTMLVLVSARSRARQLERELEEVRRERISG